MIRLLALVLTLWSAAALAAQDSRVTRGIELYDKGDFALARDALVTVVESPALTTPDRLLARSYLAAAYHALGDVASAKAQLLVLARQHPDARLDPGLFLPELIALSDEARVEVAHEPKPAEPIRAKPLPPDEPRLAQPTPAQPPTVAVTVPRTANERPSLGLMFVPFGVGQFALDQNVKGTLFLTGEVLTLGTSAVALAMFESNKTSGTFLGGGTFRDPARAQTLQTIHLVAGYTGLALMVGGVIDALISRAEVDATAEAGLAPSIDVQGHSVLVRF